MSEPPALDAVLERWKSIRSRSESGASYCADCYYSFTLGVRHQDGGGYPCPKHATEDERREMDDAIGKAGLADSPFLSMVARNSR